MKIIFFRIIESVSRIGVVWLRGFNGWSLIHQFKLNVEILILTFSGKKKHIRNIELFIFKKAEEFGNHEIQYNYNESKKMHHIKKFQCILAL